MFEYLGGKKALVAELDIDFHDVRIIWIFNVFLNIWGGHKCLRQNMYIYIYIYELFVCVGDVLVMF